MNFESIKRRIELSEMKKLNDVELEEYKSLMPQGGIWTEIKYLVTLVENWNKRAVDVEQKTIQLSENMTSDEKLKWEEDTVKYINSLNFLELKGAMLYQMRLSRNRKNELLKIKDRLNFLFSIQE